MKLAHPLPQSLARSIPVSAPRSGRTCLAQTLLVALLCPALGATGAAQDPFESLALQQVAQRTELPAKQLEVTHDTQATFPLIRRQVRCFKLQDTVTGAIHSVALDEHGQELDVGELLLEEQAAEEARFGRLDPRLDAAMAASAEDESLPVLIWLREPEADRPNRLTPERARAVLRTELAVDLVLDELDERRRASVLFSTAPTLRRLEEAGRGVTAEEMAPILAATLPVSFLREVALWPEVERLYLDVRNTPDLDISRATITADTVNALGITGFGVRLGQIEVGGRVATSNPYLYGVTQDGTYACSNASSHSTGVAGIIRSTHATQRGIAAGVNLYSAGSCGGWSSELQSRSTAAVSWGARALNLSWGANIGRTPGANDRFYDSIVINNWRTIVKSAGNEAGPCNSGGGNVTSPGLAYNVITVGNFDDRGTISWSGDVMSSCSSFVDPTSTYGDREKPELAAPGTNISSTTLASPFVGGIGSGTSFAAPMVTGLVGLLIQRQSSLGIWPESVKAILMATALHNIEGSTRLSEFDGAGGVDAQRADEVARFQNGGWGGLNYTCSSPTLLDAANMSLVAGQRTRVAIAWDNDPSYAYYSLRPGADLDLQIIGPSGSVVAASLSFDNTYEIVDFTPATSGVYKLRINKFRCSYSPRFLGWAYRRG